MFCDRKCLTEAQHGFHGIECDSIDEFYLTFDGPSAKDPLVVLRIIYESLTLAGSVNRLRSLMEPKFGMSIHDFDLTETDSIGANHLQILSMLEHSSNHKLQNAFKFVSKLLIHPLFEKFIKSDDDQRFLIEYATHHFHIRDKNSFAFTFNGEIHGTGILPFCTFFNHSCDPNVSRILIGNKFVFLILKPIEKDEQLFITYSNKLGIFSNPSRENRQKEIQERYQFRCMCEACRINFSASSLTNAKCKISQLPDLDKIPNEFKDIVKAFKTNCKYTKKHFKRYPSLDLCGVQEHINGLVMAMQRVAFWPFN
jgi:hypothetical protein